MRIRLSLQNRIFIVLLTIAILTLSVIWMVIRPKYEASVITERLTSVQQLQIYSIDNLDRTIASWSDVSRFMAWQVSERPKEGEIILRAMMTLHPEIIQIKIHSPKLADELTSQNTSYPNIDLQVKDETWVSSKIDTMLRLAWLNQPVENNNLFVTQIRFQVQSTPFMLTVIWDAKRLNNISSNLPLGDDYFTSIQSPSAILTQNQSSFNPIEIRGMQENMSAMQSVRQREQDWRVLISSFKTAHLWMVVAVPEKTILRPVKDLLFYSSSFIIGLIFMLSIFGWLLSHQISRPIARLVNDVKQLSNLDFTHTIQIPAMKDLRGMGETIELMRQVLERYQRINVDKIILEEWKNKLFMTHSDDMIGFTDSKGEFIFRNEKLDEFCSSLLPTRPLRSKHDVLTHPSIVITKEMVRDDTSEALLVHLIQYEIKVQTDLNNSNYFRVNDLSIIRNNENLGSLLIFHDLTNERLIDKMKTDMINVVVHELRNPVGSIMGFAEILLNDSSVTEEERKEFLGLVLTSSKNLSNLINRFLDVSRLESRRVEYPKVLTNIVGITKTVAELQRPQLIKKSLAAELEITGEIPEVVVSPDLYREAISNLLSNAIKYGAPERTINMLLSAENKDIVFSIIDHGYGIPPEAQKKLFTKFFRVANSKAAEEIGTGLGLAYVKEVAIYHDGSISLESNPEIGCKFTIRFPMVTRESENTKEG